MTRPATRTTARLAAAAVAALASASCTPDTRSANLPPAPPAVGVTMTEMRFDHPATIRGGRVVFNVRNIGQVEHRLVLIPLPEDFPPIAEQLAVADAPRSVLPLAGIPDQRPGARATFAADLAPGRYAVACFVVDPDGRSHYRKGMASEFRVE